MTPLVTVDGFVLVGLFGAGGLVFGLAYFAALRHAVAVFTAGSGWRSPIALTVGRLGGAMLLFGLAAWVGAAALLAAFLGFLLARMVALRSGRGAG